MIVNEDKKCPGCNSVNIHFVRFKMSNGIFILRKQCFDCGYLLSRSYKKKLIKNFESLPEMNVLLRLENSKKAEAKRLAKNVLFGYAEIRYEKQKVYYHDVYLKSNEWKHKRQVVMDYYEWKCQRCNEKATDLHHVTYKNIFKERLEDLEPLCRFCHEKEHNNIKK